MPRITLFCQPELRHRVDLLANMLDQNGIAVEVVSETSSEISDPVLVVCSERALQTPWIQAIFRREVRIAALLFEKVAIPEGCAYVADLCAWPARSADRNLIDLISWLNGYPVVAAAAVQIEKVPATVDAVSRLKRGRSPVRIVGSTVIVVALMGLLMWAADSGRGAVEKKLAEEDVVPDLGDSSGALVLAEKDPLLEAPGVRRSLAVIGDDSEFSRRRQPQAGDQSGDFLIHREATDTVTAGGTATGTSTLASAPIPGRDPDGNLTASLGNDSLSRFCRARDLASATAWLGTFTWKHRRQLERVACVQDLLKRPGFEVLRSRV